jgi:polar amino acid transport system permease protein
MTRSLPSDTVTSRTDRSAGAMSGPSAALNTGPNAVLNVALPVRRRRKPGQWIAVLVVLVLLAQLIHMIVTNKHFEWGVVGDWFTAESVMRGLWVTLQLTVICMAVGAALGVVLAMCRLSANWLLKSLAAAYISLLRSIPPLVQLIFWYNLAALLPRLSLGVPFGPEFHSWQVNSLITPFTAAILGLGLGEAAFMAEIIRGGILSVPVTQAEAAEALGMGKARTFFRIVLPQAMRAIIPATGNQVINMVKGTSLVSTIAMSDLLYNVEAVYNRTFQTIPLLLVACLWYLIVTTVLYVLQSMIEAHYQQRPVALSWPDFLNSAVFWNRRRKRDTAVGGDGTPDKEAL